MLGRHRFREILLQILHCHARWLLNQISRFGPAAGNWLFSYGDPFTNLSFPGLAAKGQISRFWPPVWKWLWFFCKSLNSKLSGSSVRFQSFGSGLEICCVHEYISLEMMIRYQTYLLPQTANPGNERFVKYFRIRGSRLPWIATFVYNVMQIVFGTSQFLQC